MPTPRGSCAAIHEFVAHYHGERNHQGLGSRLINPDESHDGNRGAIGRRERLGSMLNYYYRAAELPHIYSPERRMTRCILPVL
jgi:hypothetical protein